MDLPVCLPSHIMFFNIPYEEMAELHMNQWITPGFASYQMSTSISSYPGTFAFCSLFTHIWFTLVHLEETNIFRHMQFGYLLEPEF